MDILREHYLPIPGFENYEVSNLGNVRNRITGRILTQTLNKEGGYYRVKLNDGKHHYVHRLIAMTFFDEDITGKDVNHIDGDHWNNHLSNLEIVSRKKNIQHNYKIGIKAVRVVTCEFCRYRHTCKIQRGRSKDFFCADGRL